MFTCAAQQKRAVAQPAETSWDYLDVAAPNGGRARVHELDECRAELRIEVRARIRLDLPERICL